MKEIIFAEFQKAGVPLSLEAAEKLDDLAAFMLEYNQKVNLTRITEPTDVAEKHYLDSILPLTMLDVPRGTKCADVGTGAGFPALPMMIARPDLKFTLIDSLGKRITYLALALDKLGLSAELLHARGEDAARDQALREQFGFVTARAVAPLNVLCEYCLPFVEVGGVFAALKGADDEASSAAKAIDLLGGRLERVEKYALPSGDRRSLVVIGKDRPTPLRYPRAGGAIAKKPL
ncbi:MAG: 16S rRNA (guanine(527)-N(7))-methyltransferase RsmG [Bacteroides sp.]|nr:16S rRNA (guanine(527)-N(7))-methyltransferase RsmG [Eubacterium sp.]MCM1418922.1 16S rRNA (guanine(527)-N(7))-methyltransferase RsmG [Roseburia sp.]MCM1461531.1 16S rRNA (guanine(527)-N(7))-methyltransferase RsmG [Bacteroides sp.]